MKNIKKFIKKSTNDSIVPIDTGWIKQSDWTINHLDLRFKLQQKNEMKPINR